MMYRILGLCVALLLSTLSFGQSYGEINGAVMDATGAVIPGAAVTVTNQATQQERKATTNASGRYNFAFLVPGNYNVSVESDGFKRATTSNYILQVGDVAEVNFNLEVGGVTEVVEVNAAAQMLQTASTALGTVIDQQRIVELPLNGRNYLQLVRLSPNVSAEMGAGGQANGRQGGERANQAISIAGQRQQFNRFTLDGVENTDVNFNTFIVRPSVDALQEFKVQTGVYSAEFGRATSQINVATRSGSNQFHATLFHFLRNDAIQAKAWLPTVPDAQNKQNPFRRNQFGFTFLGPIWKDKVFFMTNYEGLRQRLTTNSTARVATEKMRRGDFSDSWQPRIYDPATIRRVGNQFVADPFPGNVIPTNRIHPTAIQLMEFYPQPTIPNANLTAVPFNYIRATPNPIDWDQFTSRVDWQQSVRSQWFGRFSWGDEVLIDGNTFPTQDVSIRTKVYQTMASNIWTISPTVVNELRLGFNLFNNDKLLFFNNVRNVTGELNIPGLTPPIEAAWGAPAMGMGGSNNEISGWSESTEGPFINRNRTYQLLDNVSWVRGNHTMKFGGEIASRRFNQVGNQFPRGLFQFSNRHSADPQRVAQTGTAFATYLLGWVEEATRAAGIANVQFRQWSGAAYFEDSWKVTPKLTMTMGLRYELTPPFADRYRGIFNVKMFCSGVGPGGIDPTCPTPVLVRPGEGDFHEDLPFRIADIVPKETGDDALHGRSTIVTDFNDFAPRIGLAYSLNDKTVVRTGYGVYYSQDTGNPVFDMARNLGARDSARGVDPIPDVNLTDPWANKGGSADCPGFTGPCFKQLYTFANDAGRRTAYIHQYMFNVQRQITNTLMAELGYMGNAGHKLLRMWGYNTAVNRSGPDDNTSVKDRRPWGDVYGRIQTISPIVNSNYNAFSAKVQQRYTSGFTYLIGYTWAKSIDDGSAIRTNDGDNLFPWNNYDLTNQRGASQFDTRHRLTVSALYDLPFRLGNPVLQAIIGGWQTGGILTLSTGTPTNVGSCGDLNRTVFGTQPEATGISPFTNQTQQSYWNRDAFTCIVPVMVNGREENRLTFTEGNTARNVLYDPGYQNLDFSLQKEFRITEGSNLEFRFESFNFLNHPNWNGPSTNPRSANFGRVTSARTMRTNQFALKFSF